MTEPIHILFVDNDVEQREFLAERLRRNYQFEIDCADNGEQALACVAAAQSVYDVALVDMRLRSGPDGIEVMKSLQSAQPGIEVIIVTGFGDVDDGVEAMTRGACNYVFKPWRDEELVVYIRAAAERRRLRAIEREHDWLQKILSVSEAMTRSLDPEEVAREICERTAKIIPQLDHFHISTYDETRDELCFLWIFGQQQPQGIELPPRRLTDQQEWGLTGYVIKNGPQFINDLDEAAFQSPLRRLNLLSPQSRALIGIPLISRSKVIGALCAQSYQPNVFTTDHYQLLQAVAKQIATAVENALLHQQTARRLEVLSRLYKTLAALRSALNFDEVLHLIVNNLYDLFQLDTCTVGLFDKDLVKVEFLAERGLGMKVERKLKDLPKDLRDFVFSTGNLFEVHDLVRRPDMRSILVRNDLKSFVLLPLHGKNQEPLGIITMGSKRTLALSNEQKDLLRALADQAAIAIENARLHEKVQAWAQQLERLDQVSRDIANEIEVTKLLRTVASRAAEFLEAEGCGVYLLTGDKQQFQLMAAAGQIQDLEGIMLSVNQGVIGRVLQSQMPFSVENYWQWPGRLEALEDKRQTAVIGVPIFSHTEIIGVLAVHDVTDGRVFTTAEADLLSRIGRLAGAEIEKAQNLEKNKKLVEERDATSEVTQALVSVLYYDQLLKTILEKLHNHFGYSTCAILLKDLKTNELYIERATGHPDEIVRTRRIKIDGSMGGVTAWVARNGKSKIVPDVNKEPLFIRSVGESNSEMAVPLLYGSKIIGVLNVESTELDAFTERDQRILTQAAASIAIAIKNARLFDQAKKKTRALRRLLEVGKALDSTLDLGNMLEKIARYGKELLNAEVCAVFYVRRKGVLRLAANAGSPPGSFDPELELEVKTGDGAGLTGHIAAVGKLVNLHGGLLRNHPAVNSRQPQKYMPSGYTHSLLAIPLKQHVGEAEEVIGLIKVENKQDMNGQVDVNLAFDYQDTLILKLLADYAETAIRNAKLFTVTNERLSVAKSAVISLAATSAWAHDAAQHTYTLGCDAENLRAYLAGLPKLDPRMQEVAKRISDKAEKIAALIPNTPPDLSQKEPVYVGKVLQEIQKRREAELSEQKIELINWLDGLPPVLANKQALHEVCDNLIRNAIRSMPEGGRISFSGRVDEEQLFIEVADTGPGIASEIKPDIFNRRVRGSGTGIGLLLTRSYLLAYDGDIKLLDTGPYGTIFVFNLLLAEAPEMTEKGGLYAKAGNSIS